MEGPGNYRTSLYRIVPPLATRPTERTHRSIRYHRLLDGRHPPCYSPASAPRARRRLLHRPALRYPAKGGWMVDVPNTLPRHLHHSVCPCSLPAKIFEKSPDTPQKLNFCNFPSYHLLQQPYLALQLAVLFPRLSPPVSPPVMEIFMSRAPESTQSSASSSSSAAHSSDSRLSALEEAVKRLTEDFEGQTGRKLNRGAPAAPHPPATAVPDPNDKRSD